MSQFRCEHELVAAVLNALSDGALSKSQLVRKARLQYYQTDRTLSTMLSRGYIIKSDGRRVMYSRLEKGANYLKRFEVLLD